MKQCPSCNRIYDDDSLRFCLEDGAALTEPYDSAATLIVPPARITQARTEVLPAPLPPPSQDQPAQRRTRWTNYVIIALLALIAGGGVVWLLRSGNSTNANSNPVNGNPVAENKPPSIDPSAQPASTLPGNANAPAPAPVATAPRPSEPTPYPAGGSWFVIIGSFAKDRRDAAEQKLRIAQAAGYSVTIIDTDNYPRMSRGYWAVVAGPMPESAAQSLKNQMRSDFPDAYAKSGW